MTSLAMNKRNDDVVCLIMRNAWAIEDTARIPHRNAIMRNAWAMPDKADTGQIMPILANSTSEIDFHRSLARRAHYQHMKLTTG
jgi:hypothetical protein